MYKKEIRIKSLNSSLIDIIDIYLSIETDKSINLYTSLCSLRNQLIENNIVQRYLRHRMYFYKKIDDNYIKLKENDFLEGTIYFSIENETDYSEPTNIMFHLEKRISKFEIIFGELYKKILDNDINDINDYIKIKKIWNEFKDINSDCFDYTDWYFVVKPNNNDFPLLNKISLDIKKWYTKKEKIMYELDIIYLDSINNQNYKFNDSEYTLFEKYLHDI